MRPAPRCTPTPGAGPLPVHEAVAMFRDIATQYGKLGIRSMAVSPGVILTPGAKAHIKVAAAPNEAFEGELETDRILNELMGKDPSARYSFIMERAKEADADDLDV